MTDPATLSGEALLDHYAPYLQYDSMETYRALSAAAMTDHHRPDAVPPGAHSNYLRQADGRVLAAARAGLGVPTLTLALLGSPTYADGRTARRTDVLDAARGSYAADARALYKDARYRDLVYGREQRDGEGARWLQYWFFSYYNDLNLAGLFVHEGDWEMIQLRLDARNEVTAATFAQHAEGQRGTAASLQRGANGAAPVVFVARGSHASYFEPGRHGILGTDVNDGRGARIRPRVQAVPADAPGWLDWLGTWGNSGSSPRGPADHAQWKAPLTFHREVDEHRPRRRGAPAVHPAVAQPPAPTLAARARDGRAAIDYGFGVRRSAGAPVPVRLVVSFDRQGDDEPPETAAYDLEGARGEVEHPFALEPGDYVVRATTVASDGTVSDTTETTLEVP